MFWYVVAGLGALLLGGLMIFVLKVRKIFAEGEGMAVEEEERLVALGLGPFRDRILSEIDSGRRPVSDNALVSLGIQIVTDLRERARTQGPGRSAAIEPTDEPTQKACRELVNDGTLVERDGSFTLPQPRE